MKNYYSENLSARRLKQCYDLAPNRVRIYLEKEIEYTLSRIESRNSVLELGCGYGRALNKIANKATLAFGIDNSIASLEYAREDLKKQSSSKVAAMDAASLGFCDHIFDVVVCIQNGISAIKGDREQIISEAVRVAKPGGIILFSSYSEKFWEDRLEWFQIQSSYGLIGQLDQDATKDGVIVCKDGFKSTTITTKEFTELTASYSFALKVTEVDSSSIFFEMRV